MQSSLDVPVLVVGFNRPDRTAALLERVRVAAPRRLYFAVDGARPHVPGEADRVREVQEQARSIDWAGDVRLLFRHENLGCGRAVSSAVDWLFEQEERGIVLEDDLLPEASFFPFCAELLERYADDERVWAVSGCNFVPPAELDTSASYRFATVPHIWGWATWRRAWDSYNFDLSGWRQRSSARALARAAGSPAALLHWAALFELVARGKIDTWDYQLVHAAFLSGGLTATSNVNLVHNEGFGAEATHTANRPDYLRHVSHLPFPLTHPADVVRHRRSDDWTRTHVLDATARGLVRQARQAARRLAWP